MNLSFRIILFIAGGFFGTICWGLFGLGLVELSILAHFDPIGVAKDPPPPTTAQRVIEWSLPAFVLGCAFAMPPLVRWLTRPPSPTEG